MYSELGSFTKRQYDNPPLAPCDSVLLESHFNLFLLVLGFKIASAEMFNQANWQRVWAAESIPAMRKGFFLGAFLVFLLMMFFGIIAMIAYANDPEAYNMGDKFAYLAFFDLLMPLGNGWHVITLILVTALAASSIDSLQNALTCIFR